MSDFDKPLLHSREWFAQKRAEYMAPRQLPMDRLPPRPNGDWKDEQWFDFCADCMAETGRFLTGRYAHWCYEYDGMAIDETCPEFENCLCFAGVRQEGER